VCWLDGITVVSFCLQAIFTLRSHYVKQLQIIMWSNCKNLKQNTLKNRIGKYSNPLALRASKFQLSLAPTTATFGHGGQYGNQRTTVNKVYLDSWLIHAFNSMVNFSFTLKFWNSFWLEIIIYQAGCLIQTQKTTKAFFTCPLGHWTTMIVTYPRAKCLL